MFEKKYYVNNQSVSEKDFEDAVNDAVNELVDNNIKQFVNDDLGDFDIGDLTFSAYELLDNMGESNYIEDLKEKYVSEEKEFRLDVLGFYNDFEENQKELTGEETTIECVSFRIDIVELKEEKVEKVELTEEEKIRIAIDTIKNNIEDYCDSGLDAIEYYTNLDAHIKTIEMLENKLK